MFHHYEMPHNETEWLKFKKYKLIHERSNTVDKDNNANIIHILNCFNVHFAGLSGFFLASLPHLLQCCLSFGKYRTFCIILYIIQQCLAPTASITVQSLILSSPCTMYMLDINQLIQPPCWLLINAAFLLPGCTIYYCCTAVMLRLLYKLYCSQVMCVNWNGSLFRWFGVTNGVKQGGVLSPVFFIYLSWWSA